MDKRNNDFDFDFTPIGQAIKNARKAKGMTREQLARIVDYDPRHLQAIENEGQYLGMELFIQLITLFDISVDEYIHTAVRQKKAPSADVWTPCLTDWTTESFLSLKPRSTGYVRQKSQRNDLWFSFSILLIGRDTITVNDAAANGIAVLTDGVAGVSFYGIDRSVFHPFHNAYMVGHAIAFPVKKDDMTCRWLKAAILPLTSVHKPL